VLGKGRVVVKRDGLSQGVIDAPEHGEHGGAGEAKKLGEDNQSLFPISPFGPYATLTMPLVIRKLEIELLKIFRLNLIQGIFSFHCLGQQGVTLINGIPERSPLPSDFHERTLDPLAQTVSCWNPPV
jgi:hypothetical protein